jgi:hypothetical protein
MLTVVRRFTPLTHIPCVMTFSSSAPRAEGIINCLHCINVSFVPDPGRNRVSGNPAGVGIASKLTGVDIENASNVETNDG